MLLIIFPSTQVQHARMKNVSKCSRQFYHTFVVRWNVRFLDNCMHEWIYSERNSTDSEIEMQG
jgi:hypothetical protein